ncbi:MAG: hypothetical protein AB7E42_00065 [Anaerotignaceae bacterium]
MVKYDFSRDITLYNGYCYRFKETSNIEILKRYDRMAADNIKQNEENIATLKEYRKQLFKHVQQIVAAPENLSLEIVRGVSYTKRVYYDINLKNTIEGLREPQKILYETYTGKQRFEAVARFNALKKQYPQAKIIDRSQKR